MARKVILPIMMIFYVSMTCVHIPYRFKNSGDINGQSAFLLAQNSFHAMENINETTSANIKSAYDEFKSPKDYIIHPNSSDIKIDIYNVSLPRFMRGIYLSNNSGMSKKSLTKFISDAREYKINTFVVDVQNSMIPREHVEIIKKAGIFPVARIVVFLGGLNQKIPDQEYLNKILDLIDASAYQGFLEVQLDYIRYADNTEMEKLPLTYKYQTINNILKQAQDKADSLSIFLSADLFGRVTLNQHDHIGQKLENFSVYMDAIYPMLYPSHYTNDEFRISHPYETVKEGVENSLKRCDNTRVIAYIQGFEWKVNKSGKSLQDYIKDQLHAVDDAKGHGWVIWNAKNDYSSSYNAISSFDSNRRKRISETTMPNEELM
jgi:hypothetical protein